MNLNKHEQVRFSIIKQNPFRYLSLGTFVAMLFYTAFSFYGLDFIQFAKVCIPIAFVYLLLSVLSKLKVDGQEAFLRHRQRTLETPNKKSLLNNIKKRDKWTRVFSYNPVHQITVESLSMANILRAIGGRFLFFPFMFFISSFFMTVMVGKGKVEFSEFTNLQYTFLLVFGGLNLLYWLTINAFNFMCVMSMKEGDGHHMIETAYTEVSLSNKIKNLSVWLGKESEDEESEDEESILFTLNKKCHFAARRINDFVVKGYIDSELIEKEKAFIEYSINEFIPSRIDEVDSFFKQEKDLQIAKKAFNETGRTDLERAIYTMLDKVDKIIEAVTQVEEGLEKMAIDSAKVRIANNDWAGLNDSPAVIGYASPYFQEYQFLRFPSLESKVVADNIVKKTLPKLVEQEKQAQTEDDLNLIREQIDSTKQFVKSIAVGTNESEQRRHRVGQEEDRNPLSLQSTTASNGTRNLALANQRYLDALDKNLPVS